MMYSAHAVISNVCRLKCSISMISKSMVQCEKEYMYVNLVTQIDQLKTTNRHTFNTSLNMMAKYLTANYFPRVKCRRSQASHCLHIFETSRFLVIRNNVFYYSTIIQ